MPHHSDYDAHRWLREESKKKLRRQVAHKSRNPVRVGPFIDAILIVLALVVAWEIFKAVMDAWS